MAVVDRPLDEAAPGGQVHHVVLVDPGRAAQDRRLVGGAGRRRVLEQLHQGVAEHHLALGGGQVLAQGERGGVDLAGLAAVADQVVEEVVDPLGGAAPAGVEGPLEGGRVGGQEVRGGHGVDQQLGGQLGLAPPARVQLGRGHQLPGQPGRQQVALLEPEEQRVAGPGLVGEAAVPGREWDRRGRLAAEGPGHADRAGGGKAGGVADPGQRAAPWMAGQPGSNLGHRPGK